MEGYVRVSREKESSPHHSMGFILKMGFPSDTVIRSKNDSLAHKVMGGNAGLH